MQNNSRIPIEETGHSLDTGLSMVYQDDLKRATPIQTPACILSLASADLSSTQ